MAFCKTDSTRYNSIQADGDPDPFTEQDMRTAEVERWSDAMAQVSLSIKDYLNQLRMPVNLFAIHERKSVEAVLDRKLHCRGSR
ncbi:hypothetical protein E1B28_008236 [Marasmius oreades]|uniref:Uncharacterized protein n=1 Tax=Marasmius oreades TaxID=181124 RepID=A0A9P7URJ3_9AGAR|nr:uncharacterized protein E1B28_008236 [Marasmius oreades]KAG7091832.1 hypothetical protein E1B28_008236 [Marasmius oreades]